MAPPFGVNGIPHRPGWAHLAFLLSLLCSVAGISLAGVFDTPITSTDLDAANYSIYVDSTTSAMSGSPADILWTTSTATGQSGVTFGNTKNPGARHLRLAFNSAKSLGTILVSGNVTVSFLKSGATYPGTLSNEADWTAADRLDSKSVVQTQPGMTAQDGESLVSVWVLPSGTSTRAIRLTHTAQRSDHAYEGTVKGVYALSGRYSNVAPQAQATASANAANTPTIINGRDETHVSVTPSYNWQWGQWPWDNGTNAAAISETNPETITLVWPSTVSLRGLAAICAGFGGARVEYLPSSVTTHPRETADSSWVPIVTNNAVTAYNTNQLGLNWFDFGTTITTRAIRLRITAPSATMDSSSGKKVWLAEVQALQDLSTNALSTSVLNPSTTNAAVPVTFTLASAGYVTLVIDDANGKRIRNLVAETYFPAGTNTVYWDGLDESEAVDQVLWNYVTAGKLAPTGTYTVKGLVRNALTLTYEFSVNTAGNPAWFNRDNTGGWLADHSAPMGVGFLPGATPQIMISSPVCELGNGIALTDLSGQITYSTRSVGAGGWWAGADHIARDTGGSPEAGVSTYFLSCFGDAADTSDPLKGNRTVEFWAYYPNNAGAQRYSYTYPTNLSFTVTRPSFGGLAVRNQLAAISLNQSDQLALIRTTDGHEYNKVSVSNPRGLAFDSTGRLVVLSGTSVVRYDVPAAGDGMQLSNATTLVTGLQDPHGLTLDSNNDMYLTDWGTSHQVKVYSSAGTFLRAIGTAGAVAGLGTYDATHMNYPLGVTISDNAGTKRLWVAERAWSPKRISRWTLTGTLDTAFYGPGAFENGMALDPNDRTKAYVANWYGDKTMEYTLDWTNGTASLTKIISDNPLSFAGAWYSGATMGGAMAVTVNGQHYLLNEVIPGREHYGVPMVGVWHLRNGVGVSVAAAGDAQSWAMLKSTDAFKDRWVALGLGTLDAGTYTLTTDPVFFAWTDTNNDQQVQPSEVTMKLETKGVKATYIDTSLTVQTFNGTRLVPSGYTANYAPIYDVATATEDFTPTFPVGLGNGGIDVVSGANGWRVLDANPLQGWQNDTLKWTYPNERPGPQENMYPSLPRSPGQIVCGAKLMGFPFAPGGSSDLGEVIALSGARGQVYLLTTDGMFVGSLLKDTRDLPFWSSGKSLSFRSLTAQRGMDVTNVSFGDNWFSSMTKTSDGNVYLVGGGEHSSLVRVDGLSSARRITPFTVAVNQTTQTANADWQITHEKERQQQGLGRETLAITQLTGAMTADGNLGDWPASTPWGRMHVWMEERLDWIGGQVKGTIGVDASTLYVAINTSDAGSLANSGSDWQRLFRTGGAVALSLGTDAAASLTRTAPVAGDLRLVVTRVNNATKATLYRQVQAGGTSATFTNAAGRSVTLQHVADVSAQVTCAISGNVLECAVPLSTLGFTPVAGNVHLGDLSILRGRDDAQATKYTYQTKSWNNKAASALGDDPYEVQLYPQVWGRMTVGTNALPSATLTYPANGAQFMGATSVTLKANAADTGSVSKVEFYACPQATGVWTKLGEDATAPYSYAWTVSRGVYTVAACAVDNLGARSSFSQAAVTLGDTGVGLLGNYYDTTSFTTVKKTKADALINFDWGSGVPDAAYTDPNTYSVRWTGTVKPRYTGPVTFWTLAEDGSKLTVNSSVLWNRWADASGAVWNSATTASLTAGTAYNITLDQYKNTGTGSMKLYWSSASQPFELVPMMQLTPTSSGNAPTGVVLTTTPASGSTVTLPGGTVTLSSTASCTDGVRSVQFFAGTELLAIDSTSPYSYTWTPTAYGSYSLTSKAVSVQGKTTTSSASTITVKELPSVTLTAPTANASFGPAPATITLTATAVDTDGTVSKVDFYNGANLLGTDSTFPYSYTWTNVALGNYTLTAKATDNDTYTTTSTAVPVSVVSIDTNGLRLWLKADALNLSDGAPVVSWTDMSGNINNAVQSDSTKQPSYVASDSYILGKPLVRFDGTDDWIEFANIGDIRTVFWIVKDNSIGSHGALLLADTGSIDFARGTYYDFAGPNNAIFTQTWSSEKVVAWWLYPEITTRVNATVVDARYAGVPNTMSMLTTRTAGPVGASNFSNDRMYGNVWNGDLAELLIYNRALTDQEILDVEAYLNTKYHVNNAPPTVSITSPSDRTTYTPGANFTITATASDDMAVTQVEFFANSTSLGVDTTSPYSATWNSVPAGSYTLKAVARDNQEETSTAEVEIGSTDGPFTLAGLKLWLKADEIVGQSSNSAVSTWYDASSRKNNAVQATGSQQPLFIGNYQNGLPVVRCDGTDDSVAFPRITDVRTVFWMIRETGAGDVGYRPLLGDTLTHPFHRGVYYDWAGRNNAIFAQEWSNSNVVAWWQYSDITTRFNGASVDSRYTAIPNTLTYISTRTHGDVAAAYFGKDRDYTDRNWDGDLAELIIFNRPLTDPEIATVEAYLVAKWNTSNQVPTASITAPSNNYSFREGGNVTINATASDANGTVRKVEFYANNVKLGEDTSSPYSYTWSNVPGGNYALVAKAMDNVWASGPSAVINITSTANALPTVSISNLTNGAVRVPGADITIDATAADSDGTVSKVEFYQGATKLGEDSTSPYSYTWSNVSAGIYSLTAKATDNESGMTTSTAVSVSVCDLSSGLMAYWPFDSNLSDYTGRGHDGAFQGGTASYATGQLGNAIRFTKTSSQAMEVPYSADFNQNTFTVSAWVKLASEPADSGLWGTRFNSDCTFSTVVNSNYLHGDLGNGSSWINNSVDIYSQDTGSNSQGGDLSVNAWYLVTYVIDNSNQQCKLYIDGDLKKTISISGTPKLMQSGQVLKLGSTSGYGQYMDGWMDDVRVYSRALNATEVAALYTASGNTLPTVSVTSPTGGSVFNTGANVTINATASDSDGAVTSVGFYQGTTLLGTDSTSPFSYTWTAPTNGTYSLTAKANDTFGGVSTSSAVSIIVGADTTGGLMGRWQFENDLTDSTLRGHDGTFQGGTASYAAGQFGNAVRLTKSSSQAVQVPYSADFNQSTFTVSAWVKLATEPTDSGICGTRFNLDGTFDLVVNSNYLHGDLGNGSSWINTGVDIYSGDTGSNGQGGDLAINTWYLVTYIIDNTNQQCKLYLNGDLKKTINISGTPKLMQSGQVLKWGSTNGSGQYMDGWMDDCRIYNRALSANDVLALYQGAVENALPSVSLTAPSNNASYNSGADVTLTATASDSDGTISKVEFYQGTTKLGEDSTSPYSYTWSTVSAGIYSLTAKAIDNANGTITSSSATILVGVDTTTGLMGRWQFENDLTDSTGRGHDGTFQGGTATYATGQFGNAVRLTKSSSQAVQVSYSSDFNQSTFTVSAWVKLATEPTDSGICGTRFNLDGTFDLVVNSNYLHSDLGNGSSWINTSVDIYSGDTGSNSQGGDLAINTWYLVTYVIDNTNQQCKLYLNGDLKKTINISGTPKLMQSGQVLKWGSTSGYGQYMDGWMDDVRIYNRALSVNDILGLYQGL